MCKYQKQVTYGAYYVWDPYIGISGQFVTLPINGTPYYIEGNSALLSQGVVYRFNITCDPLSPRNDRFKLFMGDSSTIAEAGGGLICISSLIRQ